MKIMMTFEDIKYTDKKTVFVIPNELLIHLREALQAANIPLNYEVILNREINKNENLKNKYDKFRKAARKAYMENGYEDHPYQLYSIIISNIDSDYLWEKLKICYGNQQDDYYHTHDAFQITSTPIKEENDEGDPVALDIPITSDVFMFIGEDDEMIAFEKLMKEKNLTEDDIGLILSCVRFSYQ